jgi:hypothetical protein
MASKDNTDNTIDLNYDEENDVLYASLGSPQTALSYEISKDVWLDYIPPDRTVVGLTVLSFLKHYPITNRETLLEDARSIAKDLFRKYPSVPIDHERVTVRMNPTPWLLNVSTATAGTYSMPLTKVVGFASHFETLRIQGNRVVAGDTVA